jgi:ABC-type transport system involved in multi-copper enzyme maturation permease subunit
MAKSTGTFKALCENIWRHSRNIFTIARAEVTGMMKEPSYYVITAFAAAVVFFSKDFTLFTFDWGSGDDPSYTRTMVREMGLATTLLVGLFVALITASKSIYNEIVRKTALTVLSKPVSRNDFILGKYFGIIAGIAPLFLFLGIVLFFAIRFQSADDIRISLGDKVIYDFHIFKGVYLNYLKAAVLTALSVAVSTQLPFLPNILIVLSAYIVCHLVNFINYFFLQLTGFFFYVLQLLYAITLNLDNYNFFYQGDTRSLPSGWLISLITLYTVIYATIFLIAANISFSKRDLF